MLKKCDANCDAIRHLKLRNGVFYFTIELPRVNNKRRYFRKSLHTKNYYEAREKAKNMENFDTRAFIDKLFAVWGCVKFDTFTLNDENVICFATRRVSKRTDIDVLKEIIKLSDKLDLVQESLLTAPEKVVLSQIVSYLPSIKILAEKTNEILQVLSNTKSVKQYTISEILESMLKKSNNQPDEQNRKRNLLTKMLSDVGLSLDTDYMDFYKLEIIQQMADNIKNNNKLKGDSKRKYIRYISDLIKYAHVLEPDIYKENLIQVLPQLPRTSKLDKKPHQPYTDEQLKQIFDPNNSYFKNNPDDFWTAMIALYTGARCNAAITLQFGDIIEQDGIKCIKFIENHPIKQLKTDASERIVPIASQLLTLGFYDYIQRLKAHNTVKDTDFIFPKCQTASGTYNKKFVVRGILKHIDSLNIRNSSGAKYDFHSFRKNASLKLQELGILPTYINDIIGWEGKTTMEQSYSNHTLQQIKEQIDKLKYDCLTDELDQWKEIMSKL